ncbi:MAG: Zn-dependent exopeptidase M28 [Clostridiales bacterium]|nr:Zn-dependent exopeptidase M28 [Clostridiales bacterium]
MKKIFSQAIIIILLIILSLSLKTNISVENFSLTRVKNITAELSSPYYKGRLTGTEENKKAAEYIKTYLEELGIKPFQGSYYQNFKVNYPKALGEQPYLQVIDKDGSVVHKFTYGVDYREDMLNFNQNKMTFDQSNSRILGDNIIQVFQEESYSLFYLPEDNNLNFRSSFLDDNFTNLCIFLSKDAIASMRDYISKGLTIECYIPFEEEITTVQNVIGVIEGRDKNLAPIVLSAHFDHLGTDLAGTVYGGALDNASGTAFLLELARYIKSLGRPQRSIIFAFFNAEEFGCLGSKAFVEEYKELLKGAKVFNFDMIGSDENIPLCIMGAENDSKDTQLVKSVAAICNSKQINFDYIFKDSSDHEYFRKNGIDAITFCDNDTRRIHSPEDKVQYISLSAINRCYKVISLQIVSYGYNNNIFILYSKEIMLASIGLLGVILLIYAIQFRRVKKLEG